MTDGYYAGDHAEQEEEEDRSDDGMKVCCSVFYILLAGVLSIMGSGHLSFIQLQSNNRLYY